MTSVVARLLALPAWLALSVIFALPALEASVFLGFLIPGETALVLGGVLAGTHALPLIAVLALGILGAIVGDSVGYYVGRRWGQRVLDSTLGRFIRPERFQRGQAYVAARGGRAVLLGRFTAALRALVPGLAGMSGVPYRVFLPYNIAGGVIWGSGAVMLGYVAGASWRAALHVASGASLAVLAVVVAAVVGGVVLRRVREARTHTSGQACAVREPEDEGGRTLVGAGSGGRGPEDATH
jgi:membrane-associated protein